MDISTFKELGIGITALIIVAVIVKYFLVAMKASREDFCQLMGNHIEHNTKAIENLDNSIEKNTEVLIKISEKLTK